jgi:phosphoribosylformylglycinamidine synthase
VAVGEVIAERVVRVRDGDEVVAELPIALLVDDVPAYELQPSPTSNGAGRVATGGLGTKNGHLTEQLVALLGTPDLCSRAHAFRQYDSTVQANTVVGPGGGAAVIRIDGTHLGLALTTDCNPRYTSIEPRRGATQAVAEAARNVACVGARPIAVTDCLNFGNPEKPTVAWQLVESVAGLSDACRAFDVPIVSGNVSLYNETAGRAIAPTPAVGMVGLLDDVQRAVPTGFCAGSCLVLLGHPARPRADAFPAFDLAAEVRLCRLLGELADQRLVLSAQDVSDGGLAIALAECCFAGSVGADVDEAAWTMLMTAAGGAPDVALFSEDQGRAIVGCRDADLARVMELTRRHDVPALAVGRTGGTRLTIGHAVDADVGALRAAWDAGFEKLLRGEG